MAILSIIYAPNPIFKHKAKPILEVNQEIKDLASDMLETMYFEGAVGIGANMVGIEKQIIVLDIKPNHINDPYIMLNPEIIEASQEISEYDESSLSFPGISAKVKRAKKIKVKYLDLESKEQLLEADNFLARVILHEIDYLNGKVYLDHLSKMKRDMLMNKMLKFIKNNPPHIHGSHCNH